LPNLVRKIALVPVYLSDIHIKYHNQPFLKCFNSPFQQYFPVVCKDKTEIPDIAQDFLAKV